MLIVYVTVCFQSEGGGDGIMGGWSVPAGTGCDCDVLTLLARGVTVMYSWCFTLLARGVTDVLMVLHVAGMGCD